MIIKWITSSMYLSQYKFNKFGFTFFVHFSVVALIFCGVVRCHRTNAWSHDPRSETGRGSSAQSLLADGSPLSPDSCLMKLWRGRVSEPALAPGTMEIYNWIIHQYIKNISIPATPTQEVFIQVVKLKRTDVSDARRRWAAFHTIRGTKPPGNYSVWRCRDKCK